MFLLSVFLHPSPTPSLDAGNSFSCLFTIIHISLPYNSTLNTFFFIDLFLILNQYSWRWKDSSSCWEHTSSGESYLLLVLWSFHLPSSSLLQFSIFHYSCRFSSFLLHIRICGFFLFIFMLNYFHIISFILCNMVRRSCSFSVTMVVAREHPWWTPFMMLAFPSHSPLFLSFLN